MIKNAGARLAKRLCGTAETVAEMRLPAEYAGLESMMIAVSVPLTGPMRLPGNPQRKRFKKRTDWPFERRVDGPTLWTKSVTGFDIAISAAKD